ncbi:hypothetical protein OW763_14310 [Clostridium aestuarii]|uniref:Permease n=1 Tax=Clostridium aestuarii TaxID=338193 RepID=A0ABT4D2P7_9CLOT|nr:hypothetical protein [Clostridium aestuarii]MCY6485504.1 hypothetical protein [Clostridium aestuarii]
MLSIESIDPFLMQLVIIPFITIGGGVLASVFSKKVCVLSISEYLI